LPGVKNSGSLYPSSKNPANALFVGSGRSGLITRFCSISWDDVTKTCFNLSSRPVSFLPACSIISG